MKLQYHKQSQCWQQASIASIMFLFNRKMSQNHLFRTQIIFLLPQRDHCDGMVTKQLDFHSQTLKKVIRPARDETSCPLVSSHLSRRSLHQCGGHYGNFTFYVLMIMVGWLVMRLPILSKNIFMLFSYFSSYTKEGSLTP